MIILTNISTELHLPIWAVLIVAGLLALFGVGRLTRAITYDDFPPTIWVRIQWDKLTGTSTWNKLFHCFWCLSHWVMLACLGWFAVGYLVPWIMVAWWIFWGWFALSYAAAMIIARDEPAGSEDK